MTQWVADAVVVVQDEIVAWRRIVRSSTVRFASDDRRRALQVRDGGCVSPGCDRPPGWCDAHHTHPVDEGGRSDLALLALSCRVHPRVEPPARLDDARRRGWVDLVDDPGRRVVLVPAPRPPPPRTRPRGAGVDV